MKFFSAPMPLEPVPEDCVLAPAYDAQGVIACVTTDAASGEVLMMGHMNAEALQRTIETGEAHYWLRDRGILWHKGSTTGLVHNIVEMRIDDDQDSVWLRVSVANGRAQRHDSYRSRFHRRLPVGSDREYGSALELLDAGKTFDPLDVYAWRTARRRAARVASGTE